MVLRATAAIPLLSSDLSLDAGLFLWLDNQLAEKRKIANDGIEFIQKWHFVLNFCHQR